MSETQNIVFPSADRYSKWLIPTAIGCGFPLFFLFAQWGDPLKGMVASLSAGVLVVTASTLWNLRNYLTFWCVLFISMALHVALVCLTRSGDARFPGIIFTPLVILDFLFWQYVTVIMVKIFRR
jgi:hypothetical protein